MIYNAGRSLWHEALHQTYRWWIARRPECRLESSPGHKSMYGQGWHLPKDPSTPWIQTLLYQTALETPGFCFVGPCDHVPSPSHGRLDTVAHRIAWDTPLADRANSFKGQATAIMPSLEPRVSAREPRFLHLSRTGKSFLPAFVLIFS